MRAQSGDKSWLVPACAQLPRSLVGRPATLSFANGLRGLAPRFPPPVIARRGPRGVAAEVSTSPQARAWQPFPPAARSWLPTTTTGVARAPLPVTVPVEARSALRKPSPTTPVFPRLTQVTGGQASFSGSPLSHSWPLCWNPQSTRNLPRSPAA